MKRKVTAAIVSMTLAAAAALLLASCSAKQKTAATPAQSAGTSVAKSTGVTGETLSVYTYDAFPEPLQKAIQQKLKSEGVKDVKFSFFQDTGGLFTQLQLEKNNPKADVAIGLDDTYLSSIYKENFFQPYKPPDLKVADKNLIVDPQYRVVPFDYGGITLNYNSDLLPNPPKTWNDLLDPSLKQKIILMNPATSSPGRNFLLFSIEKFGDPGYLNFWKKLKPNVLTVAGTWSEGYGLYTQGEAPIVLSYETSPAYHIEVEHETKYKNIFLDGKVYLQVEVAGIMRTTPNLAAAKLFMDYIVSHAFQEMIPLNQWMYPIDPDVKIPQSFKQAGQARTLVSLPGNVTAGQMTKWVQDWESVMR